jgi:hypothetical protein
MQIHSSERIEFHYLNKKKKIEFRFKFISNVLLEIAEGKFP